jgi:hypothetical protein
MDFEKRGRTLSGLKKGQIGFEKVRNGMDLTQMDRYGFG